MSVDDILDLEDFYWLEPWAHWDAWENVHDGKHAKLDAISRLLKRHIDAAEVVVLVQGDPCLGAVLPQAEAPDYIGSHILEGDIQISDIRFQSFVFISRCGVAMGWQRDEKNNSPV
jgi:hypothetical protein